MLACSQWKLPMLATHQYSLNIFQIHHLFCLHLQPWKGTMSHLHLQSIFGSFVKIKLSTSIQINLIRCCIFSKQSSKIINLHVQQTNKSTYYRLKSIWNWSTNNYHPIYLVQDDVKKPHNQKSQVPNVNLEMNWKIYLQGPKKGKK